MNSNEETLLKSHLTEEEFNTLKKSEETLKQLKSSNNPADRKRVEMLHDLISSLKTRPALNNSLKKHEGNLENHRKATLNQLKKLNKFDRVYTPWKNRGSLKIDNVISNSRAQNIQRGINKNERNIKNLTNKKNRYSSLSSAPTMKNRFSSMFGFTKSSNLTNLSKTMKNRMSQSNTSVNKINKELQNKKNSLKFSKNMRNTLGKINTSRKERNKEMNLITKMTNNISSQIQKNYNYAIKNAREGAKRSEEAFR